MCWSPVSSAHCGRLCIAATRTYSLPPMTATMTPQDQKSILTIALYAAFADGDKHDREREEIRRIADTLATQVNAPELGGLYQDVLLQRVKLDAAATALSSTGLRQLAFEMAVCVCDADGRQSEPERLFLQDLKTRYGAHAQ